MITSKQRSVLKSYASKLQPMVMLGKGGDSQNVYNEAQNLLEAKELVKFSVLKTSARSAEEYMQDFAQRLNAVPVYAIGNKFVLYRRSLRDDIKHIEF